MPSTRECGRSQSLLLALRNTREVINVSYSNLNWRCCLFSPVLPIGVQRRKRLCINGHVSTQNEGESIVSIVHSRASTPTLVACRYRVVFFFLGCAATSQWFPRAQPAPDCLSRAADQLSLLGGCVTESGGEGEGTYPKWECPWKRRRRCHLVVVVVVVCSLLCKRQMFEMGGLPVQSSCGFGNAQPKEMIGRQPLSPWSACWMERTIIRAHDTIWPGCT